MSVMTDSVPALSLEEPRVCEDPAGHQPDVQVGEEHEAERDPGELHVPGIQPRDDRPRLVSNRALGEDLQPAASDVAPGTTRPPPHPHPHPLPPTPHPPPPP